MATSVSKGHIPRDASISDITIDDAVAALFLALTTDIGRPFKGTWNRLRSVPIEWDPLKLGSSPLVPRDFMNSYMPAHFFDRYIFTREKSGTALEELALEKFLQCNFIGSKMNERLAVNKGEYLDHILSEASLICYRTLGEFDYTEVFEACNHGPGAAVGVPMREATLASKMLTPTGTPAAHEVFREYRTWDTTMDSYLRTFLPPSNGNGSLIVCGNKLSFVPKKFDSLRTMQIEPVLNEFFQLGTGSVITARLLKCGIDLSTQDKSNALLARWASKHGVLATIDWSDASGRIWVNLIQRLVHPSWFRWFMAIRSPVTTWKGKEIPLQMMGTMGNGFTFPLQTLVFYAILRAIARFHDMDEFVSVFGDDCIVDCELVPLVVEFADLIGFKLNKDKSFEFGGFRESCGMDAWRGLDCRPFFVERPNGLDPDSIKAWVYTCFNGIQHRYKHVDLAWTLDWVFKAHTVFGLGSVMVVPPRFPTTSGIQSDTPERLHESTPTMRYDKHGGVTFKYHAYRPKRLNVQQMPYYIWRLASKGIPLSFNRGIIPTFGDEYFVDASPSADGSVPGKTGSYRAKRTYVHQWTYLD